MKNEKQDFIIIYYAHSKLMYDTAQEDDEKQYLMDVFDCCLVCPNKNMSRSNSSEGYSKVVSRADVLIFSEIQGYISTGVHWDIKTAIELQIPVYVLRANDNGDFNLYSLDSTTVLPERTNFRYSKAIVKKNKPVIKLKA